MKVSRLRRALVIFVAISLAGAAPDSIAHPRSLDAASVMAETDRLTFADGDPEGGSVGFGASRHPNVVSPAPLGASTTTTTPLDIDLPYPLIGRLVGAATTTFSTFAILRHGVMVEARAGWSLRQTFVTNHDREATRGASNILRNKAAGDAFRDKVADALKTAGREVEKEVVKNTPFGRRVIDIEVSQGGKVLGGVETKVGGSRYLPSQRAKDEYLRRQGYPVNVVRDQ